MKNKKDKNDKEEIFKFHKIRQGSEVFKILEPLSLSLLGVL